MERLEALSRELSGLVASAGAHVVRIEGRRRASATGVIWSADGLIVAADHTLDDDETIEVGLPSGETVPAERVGRDPATDLAVLRVKGAGLAAPKWAEAGTVAAGDLVVGLSRPGRSTRAELAMVARAAGEWRAPSGGRLDRYIETNLPLRPGLSGSLLLAADGGAIGVVNAGLVRATALVVPAPTLRRVVGAIVEHGVIRRGYLGIATFPVRLPEAIARSTGQEGALLVSAVVPHSPADRAGLLLGDALLSLAGRPVRGPHDLAPILETDRIGETIPVRLLRAGESKELALTLAARPDRAEGGR